MLLYSSIRCIIFYLLFTTSFVHSHDLFDMFNDVKDQVVDYASTKVKQQVQKHVFKLKDGETCPATYQNEYRTVLTAYRQVIKEWMEQFPSKSDKGYRWLIELSPSEFDRLVQFASTIRYEEKNVLHEVHVISDLLKRMVIKIEEDKPDFSNLSWSAWLRSFDVNSIIKTIIVMVMIGAISFISIRTHLRRGRWFTTFFIATFVVSVMQNWYTLYQEAQAKVDEILMKKLPKHCQGQSMGFFDMVKAKLGRFVNIPTNECLEYHKALRATPHSQVTPVQALSMTFAQLFTTPLGAIGEGLSHFFAGTMLHVPMFLWPVIIVLILFIVVVLILMYSKYEVHLPFMMGSLRPSRHGALPTPTHIDEHIENSSNQIRQLENTVKQLQLQIEQQNLQLEHNPTTHTSRSESIDRTNHQRERSSSTRRVNNEVTAENDLRQRTTSTDIGFKSGFLPQ